MAEQQRKPNVWRILKRDMLTEGLMATRPWRVLAVNIALPLLFALSILGLPIAPWWIVVVHVFGVLWGIVAMLTVLLGMGDYDWVFGVGVLVHVVANLAADRLPETYLPAIDRWLSITLLVALPVAYAFGLARLFKRGLDMRRGT